MALSPGTRLGPYEITAPSGPGGMGEVSQPRSERENVSDYVIEAYIISW